MEHELATLEAAVQPQVPTVAPSSTALILDAQSMDAIMRLADFMASGKTTLPQHLRGSPADCAAVVMQAMQWKMNPWAVAQKTHFVNGNIGYESQLVVSALLSVGAIRRAPKYEFFGDWTKVIGKFDIRKGDKGEYRVPGWSLKDEEGLGVVVTMTPTGEDEPRQLELLLAQARTRNSPLWADDPKQQLSYLAAKRWARLYAPHVLLGVYSPDEYESIEQPREKDITPGRPTSGSEAARQAESKRQQQAASALSAEEHDALIDRLDKFVLNNGLTEYSQLWGSLSAIQRKAVGTDKHNQLKELAQRVDEEREAMRAAEAKGGSNGNDGE